MTTARRLARLNLRHRGHRLTVSMLDREKSFESPNRKQGRTGGQKARRTIGFWRTFICIVLMSSPAMCQAPPAEVAAPDARSLQVFVQDFYDWYVPWFWKSE